MPGLNPRPGRSLALADYEGIDIPNYIDQERASPDLDQRSLRAFLRKLTEEGKQIRELRPRTCRYNCFGLVFGSRRANIPSPDEAVSIDRLLVADAYRRLDYPKETPDVGDVIIYRLRDSVEIIHCGFVCEQIPGMLGGFWIWSKWGDNAEYRHLPHDYVGAHLSNIEYWRLGP